MTMPNHVHGIIASVGAGLALPEGQGAASSARTLADVVRAPETVIRCRGESCIRPDDPRQPDSGDHQDRPYGCVGTVRGWATAIPCRGEACAFCLCFALTETLKQRRPS